MKALVLAMGVVLLSGCFLKQNQPNNLVTSGKNVNAEGVVRVEEISGAESTTTIEATFAEYKPKRGPRPMRDLSYFDGGLNVLRERTPGCNAYKIAKGREATPLLSVGKLSFGLALQENMTEVPENADHAYKASLKANLPSNLYVVKASGSPQVPGFTAALSFPVALENVTVASQATAFDDVILTKEQALKLEWSAPAVPHSGHVMLMELYSPQAQDVYLLRCLGLESDFGLDGVKRTWNIPAGYMALMPPTNDGLIFLTRAIEVPSAYPTLVVGAQGFQTNLTRFKLQ